MSKSIKQTLAETQTKIFHDPIHRSYGDSSKYRCIKESDHLLFQEVADSWREKDKTKFDFKDLTELEFNRVFILGDAYGWHVIPDDVFADNQKIYEFLLKEHNAIIGEFLDKPPFEPLFPDHDFTGQKITEVDYKYISCNYKYIQDEKFLHRQVSIDNEEYAESILLFLQKDKVRLRVACEEYCEHDIDSELSDIVTWDGYNEKIVFRKEVLFVKDLDDVREHMNAINEYVYNDEDFFQGENRIVTVKERNNWGIPYKNSLNYSLTLEE